MENVNNRLEFIFAELNRIKDIQIGIKPILEEALEQKKIPQSHQLYELGLKSFNDYWKHTKSDVFFEVSLLVRLGSIIEHGLRIYFMYKLNLKNTTELYNYFSDNNGKLKDVMYSEGVFQRWDPNNKSNVIALFAKYINIDLEQLTFCNVIKEIVIHRNQFVHKLGMIDEKYINNIYELTSVQIKEESNVKEYYPNVDYVYLEATEKLEEYIKKTISFFEELTTK